MRSGMTWSSAANVDREVSGPIRQDWANKTRENNKKAGASAIAQSANAP